MAASDQLPEVEKLYLAYYGRSADAAGLAYWAVRLDSVGGNLNGIVEAFANSPEASQLYGGLSGDAKINKIYQQLFGHDADPAGMQFYSGKLASGQMTQASIMLNVLDGAQNSDLSMTNGHVQTALGQIDSASLLGTEYTYALMIGFMPMDVAQAYNMTYAGGY